MFKRLLTLVIISLCISLLFPFGVFATSCSGVETSILNCDVGGNGGVYYILWFILDTMAIGVGILGIIGISWAGIQYLTAGGDVSRTVKAKRRILEIIIGVACYAMIYTFTGWLTPGGIINKDSSGVENISISINGKTYVGQTITPTVTFNESASDKSFSLVSDNDSIAKTYGIKLKCVEVGEANIEAVSSNGKKASTAIKCENNPDESSSEEESTASTTDPNQPTETAGNTSNTKLKGKPNMRQETKKIIDDHRVDFFYNNFKKKIGSYSKYKKYVQNLGGVFTKYASLVNKNGKIKKIKVKTAADLQEAAEYVWGLWTIWGEDYDNGSVHHTWRKGKSWKNGKNDGFYAGLPGRTNIHGYSNGNINDILSKSSNVRTNCNIAINTFIKSTSLKGIGGAGLHTSEHLRMSKVGKITKTNKLQVGDIVHFFNGSGSWRHVAMVGEVYKDYVVIYDGGGRFAKSGNYKKITKRTNSAKMTDDYSGYSYRWWAFRPWNIDQNITLKGIN